MNTRAKIEDGFDCSSDESCVILRYWDEHDMREPGSLAERLAVEFVCESDQWQTEEEQGLRGLGKPHE